jgi:hypothetical protein
MELGRVWNERVVAKLKVSQSSGIYLSVRITGLLAEV